MTTKPQKKTNPAAGRVPLSVIRRFARRVAERFRPNKIILFGSHAYGQPNSDSDVDILVVMAARNQLDQAAKIRLAIRAPFPMDLIVRTPKNIQQGAEDCDSFTMEILSKGKILYEEVNPEMGPQSRSRPRHRPAKQPKQNAAT